jgi:DNA-binding transcriptional ArsR family regulator
LIDPPEQARCSRPCPSGFPSRHRQISRHLRVLEHAGLISRRVERQWRYLRIKEEALAPVENWISRQRRHWEAAFDRLEAVAASRVRKRQKS